MEPTNILHFTVRSDFREWLEENHSKERECWIALKRGSVPEEGRMMYLDAVEEALCFGWIDSTTKSVDGVTLQRFAPRSKRSRWSELNKERCRRLEKLGLMTDAGRAVLPDMTECGFSIDEAVMERFREDPVAWGNFRSFPPLYQRVRIDTIQRDMSDPDAFERKVSKLVQQSHDGVMFGEWNDRGRLLDYRTRRMGDEGFRGRAQRRPRQDGHGCPSLGQTCVRGGGHNGGTCGPLDGLNILDAGCGRGRHAIEIAQMSFLRGTRLSWPCHRRSSGASRYPKGIL